jgi:hypothetical protein
MPAFWHLKPLDILADKLRGYMGLVIDLRNAPRSPGGMSVLGASVSHCIGRRFTRLLPIGFDAP